jgi:hypothetical protein
MAELGGLPSVGDEVTVLLPPSLDDEAPREAVLTVLSVARHVPGKIRLAVTASNSQEVHR